jgi:hypothetical protein
VNREADLSETELRLSWDTKAALKIGLLSRGGNNRIPTDASDHDFHPDAVLLPVGILVPKSQELWIYFVDTKATADCLVDVLGLFWHENRNRFPKVQRLVLNQDNGPENNSHRTQFMARMVQFADASQLDVKLAYYPPYHSKYNSIERTWGVLENHWRGEIIDTVQAAIGLARDMTWCGTNPVVRLITTIYENGKSVAKRAMQQLEATRFRREDKLGRWFIDIAHQPVA